MSQIALTSGLAGLLVPDPRITPDTWTGTVSGCPEAGPRSGQPIPDQSGSQLIVSASGEQSDTVYRVRVQRGGFPGGRAEYAWTDVVGGVSGTYRGANLPNLAQDLRHVGVGASPATAGHPASCTTRSGRVIQVWGQSVVGVVTVNASYSDDLITWTGVDGSITLISSSPTADEYIGVDLDIASCACVRWDDARERVQAWIRAVDPVDGASYQFHLFESADEGETWALVQRDTLAVTWGADETPREPVIGEVAGALLLVQPNDDSTNYYAAQWVSTDHGRSFSLIKSDSIDKEHFRLVEHRGRLVAAAVSTADDVETVVLASAYTEIHTADWTALPSPTGVGTVALCAQHGRLYLFATDAAHYSLSVRTSDTGEADNWDEIGHELLSFEGSGNNVDVAFLSATAALGGVSLALRLSDTGTASEARGRLFALRCGGWATVTLPPTAALTNGVGALSFGPVNASAGAYWLADAVTWYPALLPSALTYTATGTGTVNIYVTEADSPRMEIACSAGVQQHYADTFTADPAKGILVYLDCMVSDGGSTTSTDSGVTIVLSDGVTEYSATLRMSASTGLLIRDNVAGSSGSVILNDVTQRGAFLVAIREQEAGVSAQISVYRAGYGALDDYAVWEPLGTKSLSPDTASPAAASSIDFGVLSTSSGVAIEQTWYAVHYIAASGVPGGHDLALAWASPDDLRGAPCSPWPADLAGGLKVAFSGGPGKVGETYTISPRYDYAKEHVYPHLYPSPRDGWRSLVDSSHAIFEWTWDAADDWPEGLGSSTWGIALLGVNFAAAEWEGFTSAGSWTSILSLDGSTGLSSLPYRVAVRGTTRGPYLTVDTGGSGSAGRYIHENELAGGTVAIGSTRFKIIRNTSGTWSTSAGKKPVIFLDPEGWDPATPTTGTCSIWAPSMVGIKHGMGSTEYRRLRLRVTVQDTADGDFRIGKLIVGPVVGFGRRYSYGRTWTMEPGGAVVDLSGGARASVVAAPARRVASFAWSDGIPTRQLHADTLDPDYITAGSSSGVAHALATQNDLHTVLEGVLAREDVAGGHLPVVFLPAMAYVGSSSSEVITDPHRFLYGRIVSSVSMSMPIGTEEDTEIVQVGEIRIEGER